MLTQEADMLSKRTHIHTPLLHTPSDAILITSLRFDLSPLDQMADVFILEGEEMKLEWLYTAQWHKTGGRTNVLEDDRVFYQQGDHIELLLNQREPL